VALGLLLLVQATPALASVSPYGEVCGHVVDAETGEPLVSATVHLPMLNRHAVVDREGSFCFTRVPTGTYELRVRRVGMVTLTKTVAVEAETSTEVRIEMVSEVLQSEGVVVTARELKRSSAVGTASRIDRSAIEHVQASSLADLLELVPGQLASNPSLSSPQESLLRQVPTVGDAARANALGTSLVLDGAPVSNNANLQIDVPTPLRDAASGRPAFASTAGGGVDLRRIAPDQIASIEVVRGIPSARHGDLTAGMLLVNTRAGAMRPEFRLRANPTTLDLGTAAGWETRGRTGLSLTGNLAASQNDPRQTRDRFERLTLQSTWSQSWVEDQRLRTTFRLSGYRTLDERRRNPDDDRYDRTRYSLDQGIRAHLSGDWQPHAHERTEVSWDASVDYREQEGYVQERVTQPGVFPLSDARADTTRRAEFGPLSYLSEVTVHGQPLDVYTRLEAEHTAIAGDWVLVPRIGSELRYSNNYGRGRQFDPLRPPRMHYSMGDRPRSYREVPGLPIWSTYIELGTYGTLFGRLLTLNTGLRYDNISPTALHSGRFGVTLSPRLNIQLELVDNWAVRAGYGRMAKAPSMNFLYPGPHYFDLVNFNYYPQEPEERLLILTTRVIEPDNTNLRAYTNDKVEVGLSGATGGADLSITGFNERTRGAFGLTLLPVAFVLDRFEVDELRDGAPPVVSESPPPPDTLVRAYHTPQATRNINSWGVELALDLPEWSALRTSLHVTGGWTVTRFNDRARDIDTDALFRTQPPPGRIGVYRNHGTQRDRLVTSLRFVHRVPKVGLVVSMLAQTLWWDRERRINTNDRPIGYLTREGNYVPLSREEALTPTYDRLERARSKRYYRTEDPPPLWLFNMRLSKSLPADLEFSFFANNVFAHRPLYERARSTGLSRRNPPLFFGVELVARL